MSIISSVLSTLSGGLIGQIGEVIGKTNTTDKERLEIAAGVERAVQEFTIKATDQLLAAEAQLTERMRLDMSSDSWLAKNVRPIVLVYLTLVITLFAVASTFWLPADKVAILKTWVEMFTVLLLTVYSFYFGSRGVEKVAQMIVGKKEGKKDI